MPYGSPHDRDAAEAFEETRLLQARAMQAQQQRLSSIVDPHEKEWVDMCRCDGARELSTYECHMQSEGGCGMLPSCPRCRMGQLFLRSEASFPLLLLRSLSDTQTCPFHTYDLVLLILSTCSHVVLLFFLFLSTVSQTPSLAMENGGAAATFRWGASTEQTIARIDRARAPPSLPPTRRDLAAVVPIPLTLSGPRGFEQSLKGSSRPRVRHPWQSRLQSHRVGKTGQRYRPHLRRHHLHGRAPSPRPPRLRAPTMTTTMTTMTTMPFCSRPKRLFSAAWSALA